MVKVRLNLVYQLTERERVDAALRQRSEELNLARIEAENKQRLLEAVMEALPVGMAITDTRGASIRVNEAFNQVWGSPVHQPKSFDDYADYQAWWADSGKPVVPEEWASAQVVQKGEAVIGQIMQIRRFDGTHGFVINSASPIFNAKG